MPDLATELEALHATVVRTIRDRVENGSEDEDGRWKPASSDDLRLALQLLKQNAVTANLSELDQSALKSKMAGKLNFSSLKDKIVRLPATTGHPPDAA